MNWFSRLMNRNDSSTTVHAPSGNIEVQCSARANRALSQRSCPMVAELELAFACILHKQVRFHDMPPQIGNAIEVNDKLSLLITTIVPNTCDTDQAKAAAKITAQKFGPKWVRIDYRDGEWIGEYGLRAN